MRERKKNIENKCENLIYLGFPKIDNKRHKKFNFYVVNIKYEFITTYEEEEE